MSDERQDVPPPAECSRCGTTLDGTDRAGSWWSQVRDVRITTLVTEYQLPLLACRCCGKVNAAQPPPGAHPGSISYGPGINTAAVLLTSYGNNCSEQAVKAAKRHQAVSGYWHTQQTLARWCRIRSYLDSAASHGLTALDATTRALAGEPWLPIPAS